MRPGTGGSPARDCRGRSSPRPRGRRPGRDPRRSRHGPRWAAAPRGWIGDDNRPAVTIPGALTGRRVVVTRSRAQARSLRELLEADGAEVIEVPAIRIAPPRDYGPVDAAIDRLPEYDWVVFTSQNAVEAFLDRLRQARAGGIGDLERVRIAVIGPATAQA